ncbi:TPA: NPCBM/NEW2 domain-containing protein [Streptococcus equi subsp. zooepidemicus]|uniref:NPCBM/NEW2 domain-containing protein n=1 Tax=Streptococcus equi TaxID=1336 RepID=UPI0013F638C2|nr:NPCBM/NEW2 domain-containing protein [Streptococcus equi]QTR94629.1 hypothetical protein IEMOCGPF_01723 [Streptococcus equi subsp. zooepidemicus]HEL0028059.1 NPCBM/NEW2 domain-containing protein [Streptococcus equi subsp. zooepidemicus]HEL0579602.1 NPCBM/NEW2 domain-containing protein [Streptococcus equi subsp. zooepidemicus]HEL0583843.1 NPCBM/NEW2 domain-containing protein [Streptococcus equi subsp. zooepidemicus]HEL0669475.1 NPCBM/NEW2 domain-containing protein [Streptococcus equi subsp. 
MFKPYTDGKQRFAIKTFKTGAASVLVATLFLTLGLTTVSADEQQVAADTATAIATTLEAQEAVDQQAADQSATATQDTTAAEGSSETLLVTVTATTETTDSKSQVAAAEQATKASTEETTKQEQTEVSQAVETTNKTETKDYIYLSDETRVNPSKVGHGSFLQDKNPAGGTITLVVDGEVLAFDKGIAVHAPSQLYYDVEQYSNEYTRLSAYLGVDYSRRGKGDGVSFNIYKSKDGKSWESLVTTGTVTGTSEAVYVDLDITGAKYVKLIANSLKNNGNDHSVYADLRLLKTDYDLSSEGSYDRLKTTEEYDALLSKNSVTDNYDNPDNLALVLEREFVNRVGYHTIQSAVKKNEKVKVALDWLLSDEDALSLFLEAGSMFNGSTLKTLNALGDLYAANKADLEDKENGYIYKKMMLATAVAYCKEIKSFVVNYGGAYLASDPVLKYQAFKELYRDNEFLRKEEFANYNMELVRAVMDAKIDDEEILWLHHYAEQKYGDKVASYTSGYSYTKYKNIGYGGADMRSADNQAQWTEKYQLVGTLNDDAFNVTYDNRHRIWMLMEKGAICWGLSNLGVAVNEVFGIPAVNIYQKGHEAYLVYRQDDQGNGIWDIRDSVYGNRWAISYSRWGTTTATEARLLLGWGLKSYNDIHKNASYMLLAQAALNQYDKFKESLYYNLIANVYKAGSDQQIEAYSKALDVLELNLDTYDGLIEAYAKNGQKTDQDWLDLGRRVIAAYTYYPQVMVEAIKRITPNISDQAAKAELDMLSYNALLKAKAATDKEVLQSNEVRIIANYILTGNPIKTASFSFDDKTLRLHENYQNTDLTVRYSIDNGKTWLETKDKVIVFSDDLLTKLNVEDGILVGFDAVSATYRIDLTKAAAPTNSSLYGNDLENRLIGTIEHLEVSLDNGQSWQAYDGTERFNDNITVLARYRAHGTSLASGSVTYTFTTDSTDATMHYISIDDIQAVTYANEQSGRSGKHMVDGRDMATQWHTLFNQVTEDKSYTVEFKDDKNFSAIAYLPGGVNGMIHSAKVDISSDGKVWTTVVDSTDWKQNTELKTVSFTPTTGRFVRITALDTYGKSSGQANKFVSGSAYRFFEDISSPIEAPVRNDILALKDSILTILKDSKVPAKEIESFTMTNSDLAVTATEKGRELQNKILETIQALKLTGTYYIVLENTGAYDDLADLLNHQLVITYQDKAADPLYVLAMNSLSSGDEALDAEYSLDLIKSALKSALESENIDLKTFEGLSISSQLPAAKTAVNTALMEKLQQLLPGDYFIDLAGLPTAASIDELLDSQLFIYYRESHWTTAYALDRGAFQQL